MKSQRQLQIGENIKRLMSEIFMRDDLLTLSGSYITILEADVSPDAKNVKFFIDIFGNEKEHEKIVAELNEAAPHFRHELASQITLRVVPNITFILDRTSSKAKSIEDLINEESKNFK
ncbi:MAG: 30S ribosome-binding factor RbfA [Rickettsiales bacterium]|nr:30S ribosome-binding factor RbfA [Rickettsiales bacterium]